MGGFYFTLIFVSFSSKENENKKFIGPIELYIYVPTVDGRFVASYIQWVQNAIGWPTRLIRGLDPDND